jgi:hypothetical protein
MLQSKALELATRFAQLLIEGSERLTSQPEERLTPRAARRIAVLKESKDAEALDPTIQEIVLFGVPDTHQDSTACTNGIKLMMFDKGFYSDGMSFESKERPLRGNLRPLLEDWFGFMPGPAATDARLETLAGLYVLPVRFFSDEHFPHHALGTLMRFDRNTERFIPTDFAYFEEKYDKTLALHG